MYDIVINATLSGDSVLGVASVSKDGKPFTDYSATYHSMSADQIKMLNAHVQAHRPHARTDAERPEAFRQPHVRAGRQGRERQKVKRRGGP